VTLLHDSRSRAVYQEICAKIHALASAGARLIVCDCSRHNFFQWLGIRNPFVPAIEWHKHQAPETWASLFGEAGFVSPGIRWSSFNTLRHWGRALTGNRFVAYFLASHFCLTMEKPGRAGQQASPPVLSRDD
jgi:hypothetical protein